ncbi:MAG: hypothetical protein WC362_07345 [Methanoregula sp.]|jgi:hypothetical protein
MTDAEYNLENQYPEESHAKPAKLTWYIITSEEVGIIHRYLSEIEQDAPEHATEGVSEIARIITSVEQRMA